MSHGKYAPVGYSYAADDFCLDCIPEVFAADNRLTLSNYIQDDGCNCTECVLDRMADDLNLDRYNERGFDSGDFPKSISYFNEIHLECEPSDLSDAEHGQACNARCAHCEAVIDGTWNSKAGDDVCPVWDAQQAARDYNDQLEAAEQTGLPVNFRK